MAAPIWFLDPDGVINSVGMPEASDRVDPDDYVTIDVTTSEGITWPISYSAKVIAFISEMSRFALAEVRWLTT